MNELPTSTEQRGSTFELGLIRITDRHLSLGNDTILLSDIRAMLTVTEPVGRTVCCVAAAIAVIFFYISAFQPIPLGPILKYLSYQAGVWVALPSGLMWLLSVHVRFYVVTSEGRREVASYWVARWNKAGLEAAYSTARTLSEEIKKRQ